MEGTCNERLGFEYCCLIVFLIMWFIPSLLPAFKRNEEMRAIEVLPILKEKVAFLSGECLLLID